MLKRGKSAHTVKTMLNLNKKFRPIIKNYQGKCTLSRNPEPIIQRVEKKAHHLRR